MEDRYMYEDMSKILKDRQIGDFKLSHFTINNHDGYAMCHGITPGDYVSLEHCGSPWESSYWWTWNWFDSTCDSR